MISPPCLRASSMPRVLLPVAVWPRMARIGGGRRYVLRKASSEARPNRINRPELLRAGRERHEDLPVVRGRFFVVKERDGEEDMIGRIFRRKRLRRVGRQKRVHCGPVERLDVGGPFTSISDMAPSLDTLNVMTTCPCRFITIAASGTYQLRLTWAMNRRSHGPNSTPLAVELNQPLRVAASLWIVERLLLDVPLQVPEGFAERARVRTGLAELRRRCGSRHLGKTQHRIRRIVRGHLPRVRLILLLARRIRLDTLGRIATRKGQRILRIGWPFPC